MFWAPSGSRRTGEPLLQPGTEPSPVTTLDRAVPSGTASGRPGAPLGPRGRTLVGVRPGDTGSGEKDCAGRVGHAGKDGVSLDKSGPSRYVDLEALLAALAPPPSRRRNHAALKAQTIALRLRSHAHPPRPQSLPRLVDSLARDCRRARRPARCRDVHGQDRRDPHRPSDRRAAHRRQRLRRRAGDRRHRRRRRQLLRARRGPRHLHRPGDLRRVPDGRGHRRPSHLQPDDAARPRARQPDRPVQGGRRARGRRRDRPRPHGQPAGGLERLRRQGPRPFRARRRRDPGRRLQRDLPGEQPGPGPLSPRRPEPQQWALLDQLQRDQHDDRPGDRGPHRRLQRRVRERPVRRRQRGHQGGVVRSQRRRARPGPPGGHLPLRARLLQPRQF